MCPAQDAVTNGERTNSRHGDCNRTETNGYTVVSQETSTTTAIQEGTGEKTAALPCHSVQKSSAATRIS